MKEVTLSKGRKISTPWINADEAATYCGWTRATFLRHAEAYHLPCTQMGRSIRYFTPVIDAWLLTKQDEDTDHDNPPETLETSLQAE